MITRIQKALAARREQLQDGDKGFTLIELLVVVIIIGILAAIAIPVYIGVQNSAKDSAVKSDLTNAKIAIVAYYSQNNTFPVINTTDLTTFGYKQSATSAPLTDDSTAAASITAFCLKETSPSGAVFYITESLAPTTTKPATCS